MPENCIYDIFKCMGMYFKYTGFIPLPGIYERTSFSKLTGSVILPLIYFTSCFYASFVCFYVGDAKEFERNLTDILIVLLTLIAGSCYFTSPFLYRFRVSPLLVHYLRAHSRIHQLLQPHKRRLTAFTWAVMAVVALQAYFSYYSFLYVRYVMLQGRFEEVQLVSFFNSVFIVLFVYCQPQAMYIVFQRVLRTAYDQLTLEITEIRGSNIEPEVAEKMILRFSELYCALAELAGLLDDMVSPMVVYRNLYFFVTTIYDATFLEFPVNSQTILSITSLLNSSVILVFLPNAAYKTQRAALKVIPAIYSSFNFQEKNVKKSMEILGLQSLYMKCSFSASGLYQLDRNLVQSVLQSILTQWVVFYKIQFDVPPPTPTSNYA